MITGCVTRLGEGLGMWLREEWVQDVHMGAYFLACSLRYSVAIYNVHADYINKYEMYNPNLNFGC